MSTVHDRTLTNPRKLQLTIVGARNLIAADSNGKSDPYAILKIGSHWKTKTKTIKKVLNPQWNQTYMVELREPEKLTLEIEVFDEDLIGKDDSLGVATFPLKDLPKGKEHTEWVGLRGVPNGEVQFVFKAIDWGKEDPSAQAPLPSQPQGAPQGKGGVVTQAPPPAQHVQAQEVTPSMYPDLQGIALQTAPVIQPVQPAQPVQHQPVQHPQQQQPVQQPPPSGGLTGKTVIAVFPFKAKGATFSSGDKDIDLALNDVMTVLADFGNGWIKVDLRGTVGLVPASYVKPHTPAPQPIVPPQPVHTPVVVQTPPPETHAQPHVVEPPQSQAPAYTESYQPPQDSQSTVPQAYQSPSQSYQDLNAPTTYQEQPPVSSQPQQPYQEQPRPVSPQPQQTYPPQTNTYQDQPRPVSPQPQQTFPPQNNQYPPQSQSYPPQTNTYQEQPRPVSPQQPQQTYPPQNNQYPPQSSTYPPQQTYPPTQTYSPVGSPSQYPKAQTYPTPHPASTTYPPPAHPASTTYPPPTQQTYPPTQPSSQYPVPPGQAYGQTYPSGPNVWGQTGYPQQTYPPQPGQPGQPNQTYPYPNQQYPPQQGYPPQRWY